MKTILLLGLFLAAPVFAAEAPTATVTEDTKMGITRGSGSIILKAGTVLEVISKDGDNLGVRYRNITGVVPAAKTNFRGEAPSVVAVKSEPVKEKSETKPSVAAKPSEPKKSPDKPAPTPNRDDPATAQGKMLKKARESEARHRENLVEPMDRATSK